MGALTTAITIVLSACAGALASYIQIRATKRDDIFLEKIEKAFASSQDYITNLNAALLNMESALHCKLTLSQYNELAGQPRDNIRAYRDLEMYLTLYFPEILSALKELYEIRGRLVTIFIRGQKLLEAGLVVKDTMKQQFAADLNVLDSCAENLQRLIAKKAHERFVRKSVLRLR